MSLALRNALCLFLAILAGLVKRSGVMKNQFFTNFVVGTSVFVCLFVLTPVNAYAGEPTLIDIIPGSTGSYPEKLNPCGDLMLMLIEGISPVHEYQLYRSDGTAEGTARVKDIDPNGSDVFFSGLVAVNDTVFFMGRDGVSPYEYSLWKSDGTEAGTVMVKDIVPDVDYGWYNHLTDVSGVLYFVFANDGSSDRDLWKSDGTEAGTVMVKDFSAIGASMSGPLTAVGNMAFFEAYDSVNGTELWVSDGTEAGTVMVKDIKPGSDGPDIYDLTNVNGTLFFEADYGMGRELWKSDGTEAGTVMVSDSVGFARSITAVGDRAFFWGNNGSGQVALWVSDGTSAGTLMVKDLATDDVISMIACNGTIYFSIWGNLNYILWKSDGTEAGTVQVSTKIASDYFEIERNVSVSNNLLFLCANDGVDGYELWLTDGSEEGTVLVKDIRAGSGSSWPNRLKNLNGKLFFSASDGVSGAELWVYDTPGPNECSDAVEVSMGEKFYGTNDQAAGTDISSCGPNDSNDVWYTITPTEYRMLGFSTAGSNFDTTLAVYSDCPATTELACNDDYDGNSYSRVEVFMEAGRQYYIRLAGANQAVGEYVLTVYGCEQTMPGDVNKDCKVNLDDFAEMAGNWLECNIEPKEFCQP